MKKPRVCPACGVNALAKRRRKCDTCKQTRASKPRQASKLERTFLTRWLQLAGDQPEPVREFVFAAPRKWRADFAWPDQRVLVEIEGGVHSGGRHVRGKGFEADLEKGNMAQVLGYKVLRFSGGMVNNDPAGCIDQIKTLLKVAA